MPGYREAVSGGEVRSKVHDKVVRQLFASSQARWDLRLTATVSERLYQRRGVFTPECVAQLDEGIEKWAAWAFVALFPRDTALAITKPPRPIRDVDQLPLSF